MGSFLCLPARGAFLRSSSLLHFLSSRTDECTGNGEPGVMGCTATAGRLCLGPLGLESDALGSSALLARDCDNQLFLGLGRQRVRTETARNLFDRLDSGDGRDFWSTALARGGGSWKKLAERQGPCWRALVHSRTRLPSEYPLGNRLRSQFVVDEGVASSEVDEGESECLASSCRGCAHGALLVPIAARRWAPRLLVNGGMIPHSSSTRRDTTLTSSDSIESNSCPCRAGPRSLSHAIGGVCERIVIIFLLPIPRK
jgi:hypothetical protein